MNLSEGNRVIHKMEGILEGSDSERMRTRTALEILVEVAITGAATMGMSPIQPDLVSTFASLLKLSSPGRESPICLVHVSWVMNSFIG